MWIIPIIFVVAFFGLLMLLEVETEPEHSHSCGWHRVHGTHRVRYPDGQVSQPFSYGVAKDYAEIFGGEVIRR